MQQTIQNVKERLKCRREQYVRQQLRLKEQEAIMHNTEEDIAQMEYVLKELERNKKEKSKRKIIPNNEIGGFFAHLSEMFDAFQHRYHTHLNYKLTCLIVHARYRIQSRSRSPEKRYLSEATILSYFKYERNAIGKTIPR